MEFKIKGLGPLPRVGPQPKRPAVNNFTLAGQIKTLKVHQQMADQGLIPKATKAVKAAKRERVKLRETVAREQREIQEIARKNAQAAMERLADIVEHSHNETAAIAAAQVILDRGYGKANQTNINATIDANGKATDVSNKEL